MKLPKNQVIKERHLNIKRELVRVVTYDSVKNRWFLYDVDKDENLTLVDSATSPNRFKK